MAEAELRLEQLEQVVREALDEMKALDPVALDVRGKTPLTDMMFIVSGSSTRHVKSIADNVVEKVLEAGWRPIGIEGEEAAEWILVDLGDIVVHVMLPAVRELYRLEGIWGIDADEEMEMPLLSRTRR